jgi:hypothetical protein
MFGRAFGCFMLEVHRCTFGALVGAWRFGDWSIVGKQMHIWRLTMLI